MASVLIVGASGILAPAASALVERGVAVTGVGRRRPMPDGVTVMHVDAREILALDAALATRRWSRAIVYEPAVTTDTFRRIEAAIDGPVVLVRTSAAADPAHGEPVLTPSTLLLGWRATDGESARWHTPDEVSDAALRVLDDGEARILGFVRPWDRRP